MEHAAASPAEGRDTKGPPSLGLDPATLLDPGPEYRGVALWMLNDRIELEEATRQLRGFREAGWGAIITRTYMGTRIQYLSQEWRELVDRIVAVSRGQGTRVFLQEADTKVGGYVTTALLGMEDRFRHRRLVMAPADDPSPPDSTLLKTLGEQAYYDQMVVPPGESARFFAVMDLLDEETVRVFMQRCHEAQAHHHGEEFGRAIEAIWMDEPFLRVRSYTRLPVLPWTPRLPELFERDWGYSLLDHLPALFRQTGDWRKVRHHFWRTAVAQFKKAYWEQVGRWCEEHQVRSSGHLMGEDTLDAQIGYSGAMMPFYEDMQLPGIDYLTKDIATWRPEGSKFIVTPKQCASVANQLGKEAALGEMYGVSDQSLTFEDRKWIAEWLAVLGINYRCYHAAFYSLRGGRKRMYPPHIGHQQPYWPDNWRIADPMARLSYVMRQGRYVADVLVLHPIESAHCRFDPEQEDPALRQMTERLIALSQNLLAIHRGFDYGDEYLLSKYAKVQGGSLRVGEMSYRAVVLPDLITLRASTLRLLEEFIEAGGMVAAVGELPSRVDGVSDPRLERLNPRIIRLENSQEGLRSCLNSHLPPRLEVLGPGADQVWVHERELDGQQIIFLVNTSRADSAEAELRLSRKGRLESWSLCDGGWEEVRQWPGESGMCAVLALAPTESRLLVLHEGQPSPTRRPPRPAVTKEVPLGRSFRLVRRHPNPLTLDFCRYRLREGPWSDVLPVIGVLEKLNRLRCGGPVRLQYRFSAEFRPDVCAIAVEDSEQCRIQINGAEVTRQGDAHYWDRGFHRIDIADHVRVGENVVEIAREFRPPDPDAIRDHERFYGTDLEAIYVIGDFAVRGRGLDGFTLAPEEPTVSGNLVASGCPFYAGKVTLSQEVELGLPEAGERVFLDLGELRAAIALVHMNGREAGAILWPPYRVELTELVKQGCNRVDVELTNTLRNLLGPHHYTGPDRQQVWQTHFTGALENQDWFEPEVRGKLKTWSDAYEFAPFGVGTEARFVYEREVEPEA